MAKSLTRKIIESHLVEGEWNPGTEIAVKIDQTLTQDATGTMAYLQFEAMGIDDVQNELAVSYVDHNTVQIGFENADDHRYLQSIAEKYGIIYSRAGNGICHQVHLEKFARPGKTLLGSDSHTTNGGGIGMIAIGAGGLDVAVAMGGGPFYLTCPRVYKINLVSKLCPWVTSKDVALKMLEMFTTKGNVGVVIEYGGPGVTTLTVPERATITNMGTEMGVTTSIFPSDERTRHFLKSQGREEQWVELKADDDADYDRVIELDLSTIEPMVACPHSPGNVKTVREVAGLKVDQVVVGSCTNSSFKDLQTTARILKGHKVLPGVSFAVTPGSRQVLQTIAREGLLSDLIDTGARILETACGPCIGNSISPKTNAVSVRTFNRNFLGRSGTRSAQVYLTSPETAAAAVITGELTDPRELDMEYPGLEMPDEFMVDDSTFIFPEEVKGETEIYRGPNIGEPPHIEPVAETIAGEVTIKVGDEITTDHIIPAGKYLKYRSNVPKYSQVVFESVDPTFSERAAANRDRGVHNIIVAGLSYGQGSSREHAALCPQFLGVKAVIAKSFERIHKDNLLNNSIVPLTFIDDTDFDKLDQGDEIELPDIRARLEEDKEIVLVNKNRGIEILLKAELSDRQREILLVGGLLKYTISEL